METIETTNIPNWKLRRMVPRALRILNDHKESIEVLRSFEPSFVPTMNLFMERYDASRATAAAMRQSQGGQRAVQTLASVMRQWLGLLTRDIPGLNAESFTDRDSVADDVIGGAQRLIEIAKVFRGSDGQPLHYLGEMLAKVLPALKEAETQWTGTQTQLTQERALLRDVRVAAAAVQKELVALRRTLRAVLGSSHRDYQMLRIARTTHDEADEQEAADAELLAHPATPSTSAPSNGAPSNGAPSNGASSNGLHKEAFAA